MGHDLRVIRAALHHYRPSTAQAPHRHDYAQLSFLIAGSLRECTDGRPYELHERAMGFKPRGCVHDDMWGRHGVLIFSLALTGEEAEAVERDHPPGWSRLPRLNLGALVRLCLAEPDAGLRQEALHDALALLAPEREMIPEGAPLWLRRVREAIAEEPAGTEIAAAANAAGVHRAHLSRMFQRFYGAAPSVYRRRAMTARATDALVRSQEPISAIAVDAGFSDQPHMTRSIQAETGFAPAALRRLLTR